MALCLRLSLGWESKFGFKNARFCNQVQGAIENFQDSCGGIFSWLSTVTSYTAFSEGWALYAENPLIAYDTDAYRGKPLYKYGMLKSQVHLTTDNT